MPTGDALDQGRESFRRQAWGDAYALLTAADQDEALPAEDLERLAKAAHLVGRYQESADVWARAHRAFLRRGDSRRAAGCAFWVAFDLIEIGDMAGVNGWLVRARRLLDEEADDCAERGYLLVLAAVQRLIAGDLAGGHAHFRQAAQIGERAGDADLTALARQGEGRALLNLGDVAGGTALLDEVMVAVTTGEISPVVVGAVYCSVIEACQEIYDLRRAQAWTAALTRWLESQPDVVPFRGPCLIYRAELLQVRGAWLDALDEARRASEWLERLPTDPAAGSAYYRQAELYRLRGQLEQAEEAYRQASHRGRRPEPGLVLLRLAQGRLDAAEATIRRAMDEAQSRLSRVAVLPAFVETMLAVGDLPAARAVAAELTEVAHTIAAPVLHAQAAHASGAVLLHAGDAVAALTDLRRAWTAWHDIEAPYDAARARMLIGLACRELGDEDTAQMEFDAARHTFQKLGAAPDLARLEVLSRTAPADRTGGLTSRELEVLGLLAAGKTNRAIAADLYISEKTVARHVSNIFTKLDVSSRAAATAYAYQHGLLTQPT